MQYICKCGKNFTKNTNASTTGYVLTEYKKGHECYGCPYIVEYEDWITKEVTKRECRATPKLDYTSYCRIGTDDKDFSAAYFYTLDLSLAKRIYTWCGQLDGCVKSYENASTSYSQQSNKFPAKWRAADFDNENGLIKFPLTFENNKRGTAARRDVKERFFGHDRQQEKESVLFKLHMAIAKANETTEEFNMGTFNINAFISQGEQLKQINLDLLIPYHNHKFKLYDGERLDDMVQSIRTNGVLTPIIVRPAPDNSDKYEILAGHNRCNAARLAELHTIPAVVKEKLTDDEAEMYVIETNVMQRGFNDLRISEQATVIAMRHSQMFDEAKRSAIKKELLSLENSTDDSEDNAVIDKKLSKMDKVGMEYGLSRNSVARLIRIDKLTCELKEWVDDNDLSIRAAVEISYLTEDEQDMLSGFFTPNMINMKNAEELKAYSKAKMLDKNSMTKILTNKVPKSEQPPKPFKLSYNIYSKFFSADEEAQDIEDTIAAALEMFFNSGYKD